MNDYTGGDLWVHTDIPLYEVFEPTYVQCGLKLEDNLGHLVFGTDTW